MALSDYTGPERRTTQCPTCEQFKMDVVTHITEMENRINRRLDKGSDRMDEIECKVDKTATSTEEMLQILVMGKSLFKFAGYVGDFLKWIVGVGGAIGLIWTGFKQDWWQ